MENMMLQAMRIAAESTNLYNEETSKLHLKYHMKTIHNNPKDSLRTECAQNLAEAYMTAWGL